MDRPVRLDRIEPADGPPGVVWSAPSSDLNVNLVVLGPGDVIAAHRNDALDVLLVAVAGTGTATVDGTAHALEAPGALLVPKGATRGVESGPAGMRYLTVHRARGPLSVG